MAAPYWVSVAVLVLMTVRNGETVIDPNQLEPIVQDILNRWVKFLWNAEEKLNMMMMFTAAVFNKETVARCEKDYRVTCDKYAIKNCITLCWAVQCQLEGKILFTSLETQTQYILLERPPVRSCVTCMGGASSQQLTTETIYQLRT